MNTIQCPHCGTRNDAGRSLCTNCQTPLTAYAGELRGESYEGNLAGQVDKLKVRPFGVYVMTAFLSIVALGWPLRTIIMAFANRAHLNADSTNYLASAFSAIGPILTTIICLPLIAAIAWLGWLNFMQQPRGWQFSLGATGIFAVFILTRLGEYHAWAFLWLCVAVATAIIWLHSSTKSWFGIT